jgi:hypothetical protein
MKDYGVVTVKKIWTKRRVVSTLLLIFIGLFGAIALLTYYGQHVGSFTISMSDKASKHSIYLSTDPSFASYQPRLMCESLENAKNVPFITIKQKYVKKTNGTYLSSDKSYIGYTFYLKNMSEESVSLNATLEIAQSTNHVEDAAWIWFFQGEDDQNGTIYQKEDNLTEQEYYERYGQFDYPVTTPFKTDDVVFSRIIPNVEKDEVIKFTLILWLEGQDPDCNNSIVGGSINFNLNIMLYSESDE